MLGMTEVHVHHVAKDELSGDSGAVRFLPASQHRRRGAADRAAAHQRHT